MRATMPKSKLSAVVYLLLVFLSGALVGSLSYRLYAMNTVSASSGLPKATPEEFRRHYIESMRAKVNLDENQIEQVNQILDETRAQFDQMRAKQRADGEAIQNQQIAKITGILRDDQKANYAAFRAEREKIRQQTRRQKR
jgi:Spy/CpxP family protein refolding chaperone